MSTKVLSVFGTRPEAIKMAPVVKALERAAGIESRVCVTAQHREMLDQVLGLFDIEPDHDLDVMVPGQDLFDVTSKVLVGMRDVLRDEQPDVVLVHGDTTTCFASGLAAFYEGVTLGHVEAGLRTGDLTRPFPEEMNRRLVTQFTTHHFAPTDRARRNLLAEGVDAADVRVTGNTVIDALRLVRDRVEGCDAATYVDALGSDLCMRLDRGRGKVVLVTGHRRENFGRGFEDLCRGLRIAAQRHAGWNFIYPVHMNPNVRRPVFEHLADLDNVHLIEPLDYEPFVWAMLRSDLILTDSGGIQEEAPSLGKPVLVTRDVTERPEAVAAGTVRLVGTDPERILTGIESVLLDPAVYADMTGAANPYGDGMASERIVNALIPDASISDAA
ncbi:MAG: UDP-N-acetylglucosamine 2-epimerase (non-hydrolyzing) [Planctomycetes bacterium]|nr:UDP-N-acetylglucosamine 2-epimerase (non-hydrolyzing) [Planctomycetota bacterium]